MPLVSMHCRPDDGALTARIGQTRFGNYIVVSIGDMQITIPGDDSDAVVNARQWAKALTEAADQIVERLEAETVAEVV